MPTSRVIDPSLFSVGSVVRQAKARRFGVIESLDREKRTAMVSWFEVTGDQAQLDPHATKRKSGKPTSLRYLILHDGPIPSARQSMFLR